MNDADRLKFWRGRGATAAEAEELAVYARSGFEDAMFDRVLECPLPDEPFAAAWEKYVEDARYIGAALSLRRPLIQLGFPIAEGISATPEYIAAVRRGESARAEADRLAFLRPESLRMFMHPTAAGRVPVIVAGAREDFVALVRAVTCRNEPRPIPDAMGAAIVAGYNNWDRVARLGPAFPSLVGEKSLYQDRFIILSSGPYSGVPATDVGLSHDEWLRISLTIRLEHECAHYVTRHALGTMRNSSLDELIADYAGIVAATGRYRAAWFLRFLGLESPDACRADGRIHTYRGTPPLSDGAFAILHRVIRAAAEHVEIFDHTERRHRVWNTIEAARMIVALAKTGLEGLAADEGSARLAAIARHASTIVRDANAQAGPASIA